VLSTTRETVIVKKPTGGVNPSIINSYRGGGGPLMPGQPPLTAEADIPVTVETTEFGYYFKCKRCGHEWSETRIKKEEHEG